MSEANINSVNLIDMGREILKQNMCECDMEKEQLNEIVKKMYAGYCCEKGLVSYINFELKFQLQEGLQHV